MNNESIIDKLNQIDKEDFIWVIYLGIIVLSYISNHFERNYFLNNDKLSKDKYQRIIIIIFAILLVIYLYFFKSSIDDIKKLKPTDSLKKKNLVYLSFVGSTLIAISGFIYLYIALVDDSIDVELAFN